MQKNKDIKKQIWNFFSGICGKISPKNYFWTIPVFRKSKVYDTAILPSFATLHIQEFCPNHSNYGLISITNIYWREKGKAAWYCIG